MDEASKLQKEQEEQDRLKLNLDNLSTDSFGVTENSSTARNCMKEKSPETVEAEAKANLVDKENYNLKLKLDLAREQRAILELKCRAPIPSAGNGNKKDLNANLKFSLDQDSVDSSIDYDILEGLDSTDGTTTSKTTSQSVEHIGYLNQRDLLRKLEPHQQGLLSVVRVFFSNFSQVPASIKKQGGKAFQDFVNEIDRLKCGLEDIVEYNPKESLTPFFGKVLASLKEWYKLCNPSQSIGCLLMISQWMEQSNTRRMFGTVECKKVTFALKILAKQNRIMFTSDVNGLSNWKAYSDARKSHRNSGPYQQRGSFSDYRGKTRGSFRGRGRGASGGYQGQGRSGHRGGYRGGYGEAKNTVRE